jgi:hypothetical protein
VGLPPSGLGDLFRDFDEIFPDYITLIPERPETSSYQAVLVGRNGLVASALPGGRYAGIPAN